MATLTNQQTAGATAVVDRRGPASLQAEPALGRSVDRPSRLKVRTLVSLRWLILIGEVVILAFVGLIMGFSAPYELCFGLVLLSAWLNLLVGVASPGQRIAGDWEAAGHLALAPRAHNGPQCGASRQAAGSPGPRTHEGEQQLSPGHGFS